ncbi:MAG: LysE family transporter [Treponema sp.]|nr:LysE family transporter [Treponema sp.]
MLESYIIRGLLIGIIFGVPAGVSGTITIQKTLERGFWSGFATGMGATVSDVFYASVGAFGIHLIADFLNAHMTPIQFIGGIIIICYGIYTMIKSSTVNQRVANATGILSCFLVSLGIAIVNPASMLAYMIGFTLFGIADAGALSLLQATQLVVSLGMGTVLWWILVCGLVTLLKNHITEKTNHTLHVIFGIITITLGVVCIIRALFPDFFNSLL